MSEYTEELQRRHEESEARAGSYERGQRYADQDGRESGVRLLSRLEHAALARSSASGTRIDRNAAIAHALGYVIAVMCEENEWVRERVQKVITRFEREAIESMRAPAK